MQHDRLRDDDLSPAEASYLDAAMAQVVQSQSAALAAAREAGRRAGRQEAWAEMRSGAITGAPRDDDPYDDAVDNAIARAHWDGMQAGRREVLDVVTAQIAKFQQVPRLAPRAFENADYAVRVLNDVLWRCDALPTEEARDDA